MYGTQPSSCCFPAPVKLATVGIQILRDVPEKIPVGPHQLFYSPNR